MDNKVVRIGTVLKVESKTDKDDAYASRIKVKLDMDKINSSRPDDYPWCFPLLPKTFQSTPKEGEAVLVITATLGEVLSQRYYIGPIITQPQYQDKTPAKIARSLLDTYGFSPISSISTNPSAKGSFPGKDDVAVIGRGQEDVILKYDADKNSSEVDIRAGIKKKIPTAQDENSIGNVIFNENDPAYVQVKRKEGIAEDASSFVNIVADKVNIMSNKDASVAHNLHDRETLVNEDEMQGVIDSLHSVPHGDTLVKLLELMRGAILEHVHPWAGMRQCGDYAGNITQLENFNINSILSKHVKVS